MKLGNAICNPWGPALGFHFWLFGGRFGDPWGVILRKNGVREGVQKMMQKGCQKGLSPWGPGVP